MMKTKLLLLPILSLALVSCETSDTKPKSSPSYQDADNTGRNVRDRNNATLTPGDQSENESDRVISQKIRKLIMQDDSLSSNAKNVKIITNQGNVTLRGPVNSDSERSKIEAKAKQVDGVGRVINQLEVVAKQ